MLDFLAFAQAATFEAIAQWQKGIAVEAKGALLAEAGDQHGGFEVELPAVVVQSLQAALRGAADRQLFPVGGIAGGERLQLAGQGRQAE